MNITTCLFTVLGGMATLGHPSETVRLNQLGYYPQQEDVYKRQDVQYPSPQQDKGRSTLELSGIEPYLWIEADTLFRPTI